MNQGCQTFQIRPPRSFQQQTTIPCGLTAQTRTTNRASSPLVYVCASTGSSLAPLNKSTSLVDLTNPKILTTRMMVDGLDDPTP